MEYPLWLKIWLGVLLLPVGLGCFPFIVMYFKINGRPIRELPVWQKGFANFLIAVPKGGYSRETWTAIRALPLLCFLVGLAYVAFFILILAGSAAAVPLGTMVLPLFLLLLYLFDFGMDAEWHHGGFTPGFIVQELVTTVAVLVPLAWLVRLILKALAS